MVDGNGEYIAEINEELTEFELEPGTYTLILYTNNSGEKESILKMRSPVGTHGRASLLQIYINDEQYFAGVPEVAWNFFVGGYQPAQKWLQSRKGRELSFEDIRHYQKIILALTETDRIMK